MVTRVAWAQRERRLAAIRLVGATRRQTAVIARGRDRAGYRDRLVSAIGMGLGLILGYAATRRSGAAWEWPGVEVYLYVGSGVLAALLFSTFALPLLDAATRYNTVRYE